MTEYETDQVPAMHVNGHVMKEYINNIRRGPEKVYASSYWSEMEAYHLLDLYTMYQTAQLLWNPDRDPDELLHEVSDAIWGPKDGPAIFDALKLIEETRSGYTWKTFSNRSPDRQIGTAHPENDARRAAESLARLSTLVPDPAYVPKLTLPVSRATLLELMLPHLEQIRRFALFRVAFTQLQQKARNGASQESLREAIAEVWQPIPEFDTWIGTYGAAEAWEQDRLLVKFSGEHGIAPPVPLWKRDRDRERTLEKILSAQRVNPNAVIVEPEAIASEFAFRMDLPGKPDYSRSLLDALVRAGRLENIGADRYRLARWEDTAFTVRMRLGLTDPTKH
jgi:hypothetical protein